MKRLIFIILLVGLFSQPFILKAQNNRIKFVALTVVVANHISLSYEYSLSKNHSLGCQFYGNLFIYPFTYYVTTWQRSGVYINYRNYFVTNVKLKFFGQMEFGYSNYDSGDIGTRYFSKEIGGGPIVGLRKSLGSKNKWFVDFAIGFNFLKRNYTKVKVDWGIRCDGYEDCLENHGTIELPEDKTLIKPRVLLEFGFKF